MTVASLALLLYLAAYFTSKSSVDKSATYVVITTVARALRLV